MNFPTLRSPLSLTSRGPRQPTCRYQRRQTNFDWLPARPTISHAFKPMSTTRSSKRTALTSSIPRLSASTSTVFPSVCSTFARASTPMGCGLTMQWTGAAGWRSGNSHFRFAPLLRTTMGHASSAWRSTPLERPGPGGNCVVPDGRWRHPSIPAEAAGSKRAGHRIREGGRQHQEIGGLWGRVSLHCPGEAEWKPNATTFDQMFRADICKELYEEVGLSREDLHWIVPVALCREFLRGGKPQLFFVALARAEAHELGPKRRERKRMNSVPSAERRSNGRSMRAARRYSTTL